MRLFFSILLICFVGSVFSQAKTDSLAAPADTVKKKPLPKIEYEYIKNYKYKKRNNWALIGVGPNFYPDVPFVNANINASYNFHHKKVSDYVFHIGYTNSSFNYILQENTASYLQTLNFCVGMFKEKRYWKMAAFIGPSLHYTKYYVFNEEKTLDGDKTYGVGLHIEPQFILKPVYDFGVSCSPFMDLNTTQTVIGITFGVYFSNAMVKKLY